MPQSTVSTDTPTQLIAIRDDLAVTVSVTVKQDAASGVKAAGLVLGKITTDGKYAAYDNNAVDGTEVAVGILAEEVDVTNGDQEIGMYISGYFIESKLSGLDAAGKTDMGAISKPNDILRIP